MVSGSRLRALLEEVLLAQAGMKVASSLEKNIFQQFRQRKERGGRTVCGMELMKNILI